MLEKILMKITKTKQMNTKNKTRTAVREENKQGDRRTC